MIYTITLNPSIDYVVQVDKLNVGSINIMTNEGKFPGGKGINVSRVLKRIGVESKALGFIGGFTGNFIRGELLFEGIETGFTYVEGDSRINIKLKAKEETEINSTGPKISKENIKTFMETLKEIKEEDYVVLAGSIPASLPKNFYETIIESVKNSGAKFIIDVSGKTLLDVVKYNPFFIKPNHHELAQLFDVEIKSTDDVITYGKKLIEMGAQNVCVSMAKDGAILITKKAVYISKVPKGTVVNSVGAGDSLVAGFVGTYVKTFDMKESFKRAVATGSATAFSKDLTTKEKIEKLIDEVNIKEEKF